MTNKQTSDNQQTTKQQGIWLEDPPQNQARRPTRKERGQWRQGKVRRPTKREGGAKISRAKGAGKRAREQEVGRLINWPNGKLYKSKEGSGDGASCGSIG